MASRSYILAGFPNPVYVTETGLCSYILPGIYLTETAAYPSPNIRRFSTASDDSSLWQGTPVGSLLVTLLKPAANNPFTIKLWRYDYEVNEIGWQGQPLRSGVIQLPPTVTFFGAQGQAPTKQWHYDFDSASFWQGQPLANVLISTAGGQAKPRWPWDFTLDDPSLWQGQPLKSAVLSPLLTNVGQTKPRWPWNFTLDDPSLWQGQSLKSALLAEELTAAGQVTSRQWLFGLDDPSVWQGQPTKSALLLSLLTTGGQVTSRQWLFGYDDPPTWQVRYNGNPNLFLIPATPTISQQWLFGLDDPSLWQGQPLKSNLLTPLLTNAGQVKSRQYLFGYDDPAFWQVLFVRNPNLDVVPPSPFSIPPWRFGLDDASSWQGQPLKSSLLLPLLTAVGQPAPRLAWNFTFDDASFWQGQPLPSNVELLPAPTAITTLHYRQIQAHMGIGGAFAHY